MSYDLAPLEVCEALIGPKDVIAKICGLKPKAAYPWRRRSDWHEAGDIRSTKYQRKLLRHSRRKGLGLLPQHLIFGASRAEVEKILAAREIPVAAE